MATNIDKALYQAPQGLEALMEEPMLEIEMEPEIEITELEISIGPEKPEGGDEFDANLPVSWPVILTMTLVAAKTGCRLM